MLSFVKHHMHVLPMRYIHFAKMPVDLTINFLLTTNYSLLTTVLLLFKLYPAHISEIHPVR